MFQLSSDMTREVKHNVRGGSGDPEFCHLFSQEQLGGRLDLLATVTLQPGESVGVHPHVGNGEVYYLLSGSATVAEDGEERVLQPGDAEFCADGHTHAIRNHTDAPAVFLAVIAKDR